MSYLVTKDLTYFNSDFAKMMWIIYIRLEVSWFEGSAR